VEGGQRIGGGERERVPNHKGRKKKGPKKRDISYNFEDSAKGPRSKIWGRNKLLEEGGLKKFDVEVKHTYPGSILSSIKGKN